VFELEEATGRSELERVFRGLAKRVIERQAARTSPAAFCALFGRSKRAMKKWGCACAKALKERHLDMHFKMPHLRRSILFVYGFYKDVAAMRLIYMLSLRDWFEVKVRGHYKKYKRMLSKVLTEFHAFFVRKMSA
jgi:hypothetical protein